MLNSGKYLDTENYISKTLNTHLSLDNPLQVKDLDVAHALSAKKGTPIIVKFLGRYQRNEIYANKRFLKKQWTSHHGVHKTLSAAT